MSRSGWAGLPLRVCLPSPRSGRCGSQTRAPEPPLPLQLGALRPEGPAQRGAPRKVLTRSMKIFVSRREETRRRFSPMKPGRDRVIQIAGSDAVPESDQYDTIKTGSSGNGFGDGMESGVRGRQCAGGSEIAQGICQPHGLAARNENRGLGLG